MSTLRYLRNALTAVALVLLVAPLRSAEAGPTPITKITYDGTTIRIKTYIEISGSRASDALAAVMADNINGVWQDPANQHTYCGRKVEFEAEVRPRAGAGTPGWHQIHVVDTRPGQHYRSKVSGCCHDAYTVDMGGYWDPNPANDYTFAHEAGHLFGSPDEYEEDEEGHGSPIPGREGTLMADSNAPWIDDTLVNNILQAASTEGDAILPVCIQGTWYIEQTKEDGGDKRTATVELKVELQSNAQGEIKGTGTGSFNLGGTYKEGKCEFGYSYSTDLNLDLTATGSGLGPYKITADLPAIIEDTQRHSLCNKPVDLVLQWTVDPVLDDVVFGEVTLPNKNDSVISRRYDFQDRDETGDNVVEVHLWLNGSE